MTKAVKHGGKAEFDAVISTISNAESPSIRVSAMYAVGATQDMALAGAYDHCIHLDTQMTALEP